MAEDGLRFSVKEKTPLSSLLNGSSGRKSCPSKSYQEKLAKEKLSGRPSVKGSLKSLKGANFLSLTSSSILSISVCVSSRASESVSNRGGGRTRLEVSFAPHFSLYLYLPISLYISVYVTGWASASEFVSS